MERFANRITNFFLRKGFITLGQEKWCRYMIVRRSMNIISFVLLLLMGSVLFGGQESFLFILGFRFLRSRTGGYHAYTPSRCLISSIMIQVLFLSFLPFLKRIDLLFLLVLISSLFILLLAPANNASLHLTKIEMCALTPRIIGRLGLLIVCVLVLLGYRITLASSIALSLGATAFLLIVSQLGFGSQ